MSTAYTEPAAGLDARYGRTPRRRRTNRRIAWSASIVFAAVVVAWVFWAGLESISGGIDTLDVGFNLIDDTSVSVTWQLTMEPGSSATCAVQAQNDLRAIVGWEIVDIPPSDQRIRKFTETVNTVEPAVTGLIYRCWAA